MKTMARLCRQGLWRGGNLTPALARRTCEGVTVPEVKGWDTVLGDSHLVATLKAPRRGR